MPLADLNGIKLHYEVHGAGPAVVLAHGYGRSHQDWSWQVPLLAQSYTAVVFDHRGHGSSDGPPGADNYSLKAFSGDIRALLERLNIRKCCLVAHSMSGMVALQLVLDDPGLLASLVLVDTVADLQVPPDFNLIADRLDQIAFSQGLDVSLDEEIKLRPALSRHFKRDPRDWEVHRRMVLETSINAYVHARRSFAGWPGLKVRLGEIRLPTLIIAGDRDDPAIRKSSRQMADDIPGARLEVIRGAAHYPFFEQKDRFNEVLLRFLAQTLG
jgi:3-oxoadipate enol-lactonase